MTDWHSFSKHGAAHSSLHFLAHCFAHFGWVAHDGDTCVLHCNNFRFCVAFATCDDSASVTHAFAGWRCLPSDETNDGQLSLIILHEPLGGFLLCRPPNFSNHDDSFRLGVIDELRKHVNEVSPIEGVSTNADHC